MSFAALLTHPLAIVTPSIPDPDDVDEWGVPARTTSVEYVNGLVQPLVQPRTGREMTASHQAGTELSSHTIFLLPRNIGQGAWIRDEPDAGRRFDITGVRSFEYGSAPHLEVDVKVVGSTEGPSVEGS